MGGKSDPPPAPDYGPLIAAQTKQSETSDKAAQLGFDLGMQQLELQRQAFDKASQQGDEYFQTYKDSLSRNQALFDSVWPSVQKEMDLQTTTSQKAQDYLDTQIDAAKQARDQSQFLWERYKSILPVQDQLIETAKTYNTPERAAEEAARAKGDVATAMDAARTNAESNLQSYGIDPSQGRFASFDRAQDISKAAAMASAGTQARIGTEQRGLALQDAVSAIVQGIPGQVATNLNLTAPLGGAGFGAANASGTAGVTAGLSGVGTANTIANPSTYAGLALNPNVNAIGPFGSSGASLYGTGGNLIGQGTAALADAAIAQNYGFNNALSSYQAGVQNNNSFFGGLGQLIGGGAAIAKIFG